MGLTVGLKVTLFTILLEPLRVAHAWGVQTNSCVSIIVSHILKDNMAADPDVPWELVSKVRRSKRKRAIVTRIADDPASASTMAEEMGLQTESVSNVLRDLKQMEPPVVECLTPRQPHHRLYGLTKIGEKVYRNL